ncbi:TIGR00341 family protein [Falsibacillus albus]|uniref:TIGR00341 family protein n=2 Tax=Falsibacillus albus TaxID=2478915 RepID=A0A3L7JSF4_9BACI|nr:TIGR00341 family protein [Falsibacillus albus]
MSLQLIEAYIPNKYLEQVDEKVQSFDHVSYWKGDRADDRVLIRLLVNSQQTEEILDYLESVSNLIDGFEVILFPVQAYITRETAEKKEEEEEDKSKVERASRQELYTKIEANSHVDIGYSIFVAISAVVVTIGLIKNSSAIVIGGMVIAPLLGPVIGVAFASILGDFKLLRSALLTVLTGVILSLIVSIGLGLFFGIPTHSQEFMSRTKVSIEDIVLALASGAAGSLSTLRKFPSALVGVMVAVALLPPIAVMGMSGAAFLWPEAIHATLLLLVNISSILLSAVVVFSLTGIRPLKYDEVQKANNSRKYSLIFVSLIVLLLLVAVIYSNHLL